MTNSFLVEASIMKRLQSECVFRSVAGPLGYAATVLMGDFYNNRMQIYKKRPIPWEFSSSDFAFI